MAWKQNDGSASQNRIISHKLMETYILALFLGLTYCLVCACALAADKKQNTDRLGNVNNQVKAGGDKFDEFDWDISKALSATEKGNMIISPISLKVVLAMLYEGASGETAKQIGDALNLNTGTTSRQTARTRFSTILKSLQTSKGEYEIKMGSHIFIDASAQPKQEFLDKIRKNYNSNMEKVNFRDSATAVKQINSWASNVTEGHIQQLVSEADDHSSTIMLLLNAVYFKGKWQVPFMENQTESRKFYLNEKDEVPVSMMNTTERFFYSNLEDLKAEMIKLPYVGDKFSMYLIVPKRKNGLDELINNLGPTKNLTQYLTHMIPTSVNLLMPKFEFDYSTSLRPTLEQLGMPKMFSSSAELTEIAESANGLVVSNIVQKAGISVTEMGTVAYAATVAEITDKFGGQEETVTMNVDRPFLFFIRDETVKTVVFVGKVTNPADAQVKVNKVMEDTPTQCTGADCQPNDESVAYEGPRPEDGQYINAERQNFFDTELLKELSIKESGNFVVSPASIKTLLGLVMEGAEGSTLTRLRDVLRIPQETSKAQHYLRVLQAVLQRRSTGVIVDSHANAFISKKYQVNSTYSKAIKQFYNADTTNQDFSSPSTAANEINSWVNSKTRGMIPSLIDQGMIDQDTLAVLVNAIYFDAKWKSEFELKDTKDTCFYSHPGYQCQKIPMMYKEFDFYYKFDSSLESHVVQIPYQDEKLAMLLVVPQRRDGIELLKRDAAQLNLPRLVQNLYEREIHLKLPRFTIDYSTQLIEVLKQMGLEELFSENAKLPYIINNNQGKVSAMVHKAKIEVSEKGTKAAAASGASVVPLMYGAQPVNLDADHPFYYFIYEQDSKTVLFSGRFSTAEGETQSYNRPKPNNRGGFTGRRRSNNNG